MVWFGYLSCNVPINFILIDLNMNWNQSCIDGLFMYFVFRR